MTSTKRGSVSVEDNADDDSDFGIQKRKKAVDKKRVFRALLESDSDSQNSNHFDGKSQSNHHSDDEKAARQISNSVKMGEEKAGSYTSDHDKDEDSKSYSSSRSRSSDGSHSLDEDEGQQTDDGDNDVNRSTHDDNDD